MKSAAAAAFVFVVVLAIAGILRARRLPRHLRAKLVQEVVSPVILIIFGDSKQPDSGPPWNEEWEHLASASALETSAAGACPGHSIMEVSLTNQPIRRGRLRFAYQDLADPRLSQLSSHLHLDRVVAGANGDLEVFRRLTSFVRTLAEHTEESASNQISYAAPQDAFSILKAVAAGQTCQCNAYTLLLIQCLAALGYTGRQSSCGYLRPREHVVVEAWSPEFGKWILLDPDYDLTYVNGEIPLSAYEVQQQVLQLERECREWAFQENHVAGRSEADKQRLLAEYLARRPFALNGIEAVRGTSPSPRIPPKMAESPTGMFLELHRSFAISLRNDYLSKTYPRAHPRRVAQAAMPAGAARWLTDYDGMLTDDLADLYWTLNCVRVGFHRSEEASAIQVRLGTFTPSFRCFRIRLNGRTEETSEPTFLWHLRSGHQELSVAAVNALYLEGTPSRARINVF